VQFHEFPKAISENKWRLIGGPQESEAPLKINSEVKLYDTLLKSHSITTPELNKNKVGLLYVFDGRATILDEQYIEKGTTIYFKQSLNIHTDTEAALVYFELDTEAQFSRNGMSTQ
jgi:redox-sensitive bicupin YhaK (pirin superfamily)